MYFLFKVLARFQKNLDSTKCLLNLPVSLSPSLFLFYFTFFFFKLIARLQLRAFDSNTSQLEFTEIGLFSLYLFSVFSSDSDLSLYSNINFPFKKFVKKKNLYLSFFKKVNHLRKIISKQYRWYADFKSKNMNVVQNESLRIIIQTSAEYRRPLVL